MSTDQHLIGEQIVEQIYGEMITACQIDGIPIDGEQEAMIRQALHDCVLETANRLAALRAAETTKEHSLTAGDSDNPIRALNTHGQTGTCGSTARCSTTAKAKPSVSPQAAGAMAQEAERPAVKTTPLRAAETGQGTVSERPCRWCSGTGHEPPPAKICACPEWANAKGPYPSGICPDCGHWFPSVTRDEAVKRGHIAPPRAQPTTGEE